MNYKIMTPVPSEKITFFNETACKQTMFLLLIKRPTWTFQERKIYGDSYRWEQISLEFSLNNFYVTDNFCLENKGRGEGQTGYPGLIQPVKG